MGNFDDVLEKCLKGKQSPTALFYEQESFLRNFTQQPEDKFYFLPKMLKKKNNFWQGRVSALELTVAGGSKQSKQRLMCSVLTILENQFAST